MQRQFQNGLLTLLAATALLFSACDKYETQYEGPYEDSDGQVPSSTVIYEVVYVQGGALYMTNRALTGKKQITVSGTVQQAAINFSHDRIAYKTASGITIIDTTGVQVGTVPNSANVKWFDWHANNQTIYMLRNDNTLAQFGPTVTLATTNVENALPFFPSTDVQINSVAIQPDGTVLIPFSLYGGLNYINGVYVYHPVGGASNYWINFQYDTPTRIRTDKTGQIAEVTASYSSNYSRTYKLDVVANAYLSEIGTDIPMAALSPDGGSTIVWKPFLESLLLVGGAGNQLTVGAQAVTDLDW